MTDLAIVNIGTVISGDYENPLVAGADTILASDGVITAVGRRHRGRSGNHCGPRPDRFPLPRRPRGLHSPAENGGLSGELCPWGYHQRRLAR